MECGLLESGRLAKPRHPDLENTPAPPSLLVISATEVGRRLAASRA